jgi:hypothetical protein
MTCTICSDGEVTNDEQSRCRADSRRLFQILLIATLTTGAILVGSSQLRAQGFLYFWDNPAGGSYNSSGNWLPTGIPNDNTEGAEFDLNATYTVTFPTNVGTSLANVAQGNVTFDLDSSGTPRTYTVQSLAVAGAAPTTLNVDDGTVNATISANINGLMYLRPGGTVITPTATIGDAGNGYVSIQTFHQTVRQDGVLSTGNATLGKTAAGNGTVEVNGTWIANSMTIGDAGDGFMNILGATTIITQPFTDAGIVVCNTASIGAQAGGSGHVQVHGMRFEATSDTARWTLTDDLWVGGTSNGAGGDGDLSIEDLGEVNVGGFAQVWAGGSITVEDGGTLNSGSIGISGGSLQVESGGTFNLEAGAGVNPTNGGTVTVADLFVLGDGFFKINTGAKMNFPGGLNINGGGIMHRDPGSRLTTGDAYWGDVGTAAGVHLGNQSVLETGNLYLAVSDMADTEANVNILTGADMVTNGVLSLTPVGGATTSATLTIDGAGSTFTQTDNTPKSIRVGNPIDGTAVINVRNSAHFTTGMGDTWIRAHGVINLESGAVFDARGPIRNEGQFNFLGGTLHVGQFIGDLTNQGGALAPGHSAGQTTITGNYTQQAGGSLQIELGGTTQSTQYDFVSVAGAALLAGQLQLALINGFVPALGDQFIVFDALTLNGTFANVGNGQRLITPDGIGSFVVNYGSASPFDPTQVVLNSFLLAGDFDLNGTVDAADYVVWRKGLGSIYVDNDYNIWKSNFGRTAGTGSTAFVSQASIAVPEPAGPVLVALAALTISLVFSRRSRTFAA